MKEKDRLADDSVMYTLDETIQNYNNVAALNDESKQQTLSWLKELRDLRKILTKVPSQELLNELTDEEGPISLERVLDEFDDVAAQDPAEHIVNFWLKQLLEAQKRIDKVNV